MLASDVEAEQAGERRGAGAEGDGERNENGGKDEE